MSVTSNRGKKKDIKKNLKQRKENFSRKKKMKTKTRSKSFGAFFSFSPFISFQRSSFILFLEYLYYKFKHIPAVCIFGWYEDGGAENLSQGR